MTRPNAYVPAPLLELRDDTPVSSAFGDVYFSRGGGIAETEHVFLVGNWLPKRWEDKANFTIGELGFGTGLNFLVTLKRFRETADAGAVLHYIAIEIYPFTQDMLREVLALQPELAVEAVELLAAYPLRLPGIHRIHLPRVVVTLCFGDVAQLLPQLNTPIDAWYLDGFSPAKNADMWSDEVLMQVGRLSAPNATCATFTAAGAVRRGLEAAGFVVEKVAGFGSKREMVRGRIENRDKAESRISRSSLISIHFYLDSVLILGAGIAGATLGRALAERGVRVTVLERGNVASGASGNAAGVLFPQLTKQWNDSTAWYFTAYGFALRQLARWRAEGLEFAHASPGMLRLPRQDDEEKQLCALNEILGLDATIVHWLEREAASVQAGVELATGAAFFPQGTWISPPELCRALVQHENIMLRENTAAISVLRDGKGWAVTLDSGEVLTASHVCIASAHESAALLGQYGLRLNAVGGQVSEIAASDAAINLRSILCHKGYIIPRGDSYLIGAMYHRDEMLAVTQARHAENIEQVQAILPNWFSGKAIAGRSSTRATTPDRMPYVGAVDEGLYVSTGHGSRGLLSAPLAAEMIASAICAEQSPVMQGLAKAVDPLRFSLPHAPIRHCK